MRQRITIGRVNRERRDKQTICIEGAQVQVQRAHKSVLKSAVIIPLKGFDNEMLRVPLKARPTVDFPTVDYYNSIRHFFGILPTTTSVFVKPSNQIAAIDAYVDGYTEE